ncbi:SDR family NAD(P)-dependent oxidoreductase [Streptomyces sp. NPDC090080]|uniref:SDR family NAD(P)-dependent oxidoreductase n=1 Tax=Streptomyces sp. NPDC090080 TaxID=3365939 RepID=UPI00380751F9
MNDGTTDQEVALVTGANGGIGRGVAERLAALGMTVVIGARDPRQGPAGPARRARRREPAQGAGVVRPAGRGERRRRRAAAGQRPAGLSPPRPGRPGSQHLVPSTPGRPRDGARVTVRARCALRRGTVRTTPRGSAARRSRGRRPRRAAVWWCR